MKETNDSDKTALSFQKRLITYIGVVGSLLLFVMLIGFLYWFAQSDRQTNDHEAGVQKLNEVQAKAERQLSEYEWTDKSKGIVRIPIARAMDLIVKESGNNKENDIAQEKSKP